MKPVEIHIVENNRDALPYSNHLEVNEPCQISIKMKNIATYIMVRFVKEGLFLDGNNISLLTI